MGIHMEDTFNTNSYISKLHNYIKYDFTEAQSSLFQPQPNFWPPLCAAPMTTGRTA